MSIRSTRQSALGNESAATILKELVTLDAELCQIKQEMDGKDQEIDRAERRVAILRDALKKLEEL